MSVFSDALQQWVCVEACALDGLQVAVERINGPASGRLIGFFYGVFGEAGLVEKGYSGLIDGTIDEMLKVLFGLGFDAQGLDWSMSQRTFAFFEEMKDSLDAEGSDGVDAQSRAFPIPYTVDVKKRGYPVRYVDEGKVLRFVGPFGDPGEASGEFQVFVADSEYLDLETFESRYRDYPRGGKVKAWGGFSVRCYALTRWWNLQWWWYRFNEVHNPYRHLQSEYEVNQRLEEMLGHASCVCGKSLDWHGMGSCIQCTRCARLVAVNSTHDCTLFLGDGEIWCKPCVVAAARMIGYRPVDSDDQVDEEILLEYIRDLPLVQFLEWVANYEVENAEEAV